MKWWQWLIEARQARDLKPPQIAKRVGVSVQGVHAWEKGKNRPSIERLPQVARTYGVSLDELKSRLYPDLVNQENVNLDQPDQALETANQSQSRRGTMQSDGDIWRALYDMRSEISDLRQKVANLEERRSAANPRKGRRTS